MKKLIVLFISLLAVGGIFQACDNTQTYAEMLEAEKDAVNAFIAQRKIKVISVEEFEKDTITDVASNEYVLFTNGLYMQIVNRGSDNPADKFKNNNIVLTHFIEVDIMANDTTIASNVHNPYYDFLDNYPDGFRYTLMGTTAYGQFLQDAGLGYNMLNSYGTAVPQGWLFALNYLRNGAVVKLIVPSKMGHQTAQQYVYPYFYDIRKFSVY